MYDNITNDIGKNNNKNQYQTNQKSISKINTIADKNQYYHIEKIKTQILIIDFKNQ